MQTRDIAISVRGLGKSYTIAHNQALSIVSEALELTRAAERASNDH